MWITWVPATFLSVIAVLALCWKGLRLLIKVQDALPLIYKIHDEFSPNAGSTLRDAVDRLERGQARGNRRLDAHDRHLERVDAAVERIESKLTP